MRNQPSEDCDGGIGCNSSCKCEDSYTKQATGVDCKPLVLDTCGNGRVGPDEQCDPPSICTGCSANCTCSPGYQFAGNGRCQAAHTCGNFRLDIGEECDSATTGCVSCFCSRADGYVPYNPPQLGCLQSTATPPVSNCSLNDLMAIDLCGDCKSINDVTRDSCLGCDNVPNSGKVLDACGVCRFPPPKHGQVGGCDPSFNSCSSAGCPDGLLRDICGNCLIPFCPQWESCLGCDKVPYSGKVLDQCGQCLLPTDDDWNSCLGCDGNVGSGLKWDSCNPPRCLAPGYSTPCPQTTYGKIVELVPIFDCWAEEPGTNMYDVYLGYQNFESETIYIKRGDHNRFTSAVSLGQPEAFPVGRSTYFPASPVHIRYNGSVTNDSWTLGDFKVEIMTTNISKKCPIYVSILAQVQYPAPANDQDNDTSQYILPLRQACAHNSKVDMSRTQVVPSGNTYLQVSISDDDYDSTSGDSSSSYTGGSSSKASRNLVYGGLSSALSSNGITLMKVQTSALGMETAGSQITVNSGSGPTVGSILALILALCATALL